jgi:hypothetical protein
MVSWLLAEALRDMGHEVEHRNPTMTEDYEEFDHIFLGLAARHSVGCNRSYGWLAAYLKAYDKITLYIDDVDTAKVLSGIRVIANDPWKLTKPFYKYRLEYELASQKEWHDWLMQGVLMLRDNAWPRVIVPMFPWGDITKYQSQLPNATQLIPLDLSSYVPQYVGEDEWSPEPIRQWVTEMDDSNRWFQQQRPIYDLKRFGKGFEKRPTDAGLALEYAQSWGVIEQGLDNAFFHSRLVYAAHARTLFITKWQNVQPLGEAYALLPDTAAGLSLDDRIIWANAQRATLANWTHSKDMVKDQLSGLLNTKVDA